ncbi:diguanylate cyclase [Shewanella nanhaiensis]|uniref:diguanylate cyclase n=1 Tax=Shewanella nanhaiensis TaxID=2864872 RepID=A0ABS7E892_9GAMM|nr:diguanylate cyclase [Shewanella nanhaiensis]MBW8185886.1 diguanylate cyclase [Shewanella nanhaiensis]
MLKITQQHLKLSVLLGLIGLIVNLYPIPLFGNVQLVLGNLFFVIVAILLGPWYALLCAAISSIGLIVSWTSPHVFLFFCLEALWLGFARRKDIYALYADIGFWIAIGMPLFYFYATNFSELPQSHLSFITLKQGINGFICAALGSLAVTVFSGFWYLKNKVRDKKRRTFHAQLTYSFTLILTISLLSSALLFNHQVILKQQNSLNQNLHDSAVHLGQATEVFLETHKKAISNASQWLSLSQTDIPGWQKSLTKLHQSYSDFITMIVTDSDARIIAATPIELLGSEKVKNRSFSVKDRHYFQEAFYKQQTFVSPAFWGRGFGTDPIVAISAPIYSGENSDQPAGIIEGSLNLTSFVDIEQKNLVYEMQSMILIDENERVIYASKTLKLPVLSKFKSVESGKNYKTSLKLINLFDLNNPNPEFVYTHYQLNNGWKLYIVKPFSPLLKLLETQYLTTFTVLILSLIITVIVTRVISTRLTEPLTMIANKFGDKGHKNAAAYHIDEESPQEFLTLYQSIKKSKQELISYQLELEEKVAIRTFELEKANKKLQSLAEKDDLTGLFNRRSAESRFKTTHNLCLRSDEVMVIAILDIDNFKGINDTFGHQGGDQCLRAIANSMKLFFKRDSDVISRYGGEEFLLILPMTNPDMVEDHLNEFRLQLKRLVIQPPHQTTEIMMTVSIGAIVANANYSKSLEDWFRQADLNLYQAKNQGRDKVIVTKPRVAPDFDI